MVRSSLPAPAAAWVGWPSTCWPGLGYHVVALTGKAHRKRATSSSLGAAEIRLRDTIDPATTRPHGRAGLWAGAVDNAGGDILAWVLSTMKQAGTVASIGNAQSIKLNTTVFPFILRGVSLLGIDSGYMGEPTRTQACGSVWPPTSSRVTWRP
jgi:acrylyl-CoA reductase (NADPH)